jgi:hypothetical protein
MVLDPRSSFPSTRSYVLKLHRDAEPAKGRLTGHLENMSSGRRFEFCTAEQLLACLADDAEASAVG